MKILLLGTKGIVEDVEAYYSQYLDFFKQAATQSSQQLQVEFTLVHDLFITVGDGEFSIVNMRTGRDLADYDAVLIRGHIHEHVDVVKSVSMYLGQKGIPAINDYSAFRTSSKLIQAVQFQVYGLPVGKTVFVNQAVLDNLDKLPFDFPCIMKATNGSHGNYNYKLEKADDIAQILADDNGKHTFVLQRFMPNDCDYRVLLAGEQLLIIKRMALGDSHLNNSSKGGSTELVDPSELPDEIIKQCRHIARKLNQTIAGVDVLYDKSNDSFSFLEVNSQPQLMTGAFVEEKAKLMAALFDSLKR